MKKSDTNAIANLYVESVNPDPNKQLSDEEFNNIDKTVKRMKGSSYKDVEYAVEEVLGFRQMTDDIKRVIRTRWENARGLSAKDRMLGTHPGLTPERDANPHGSTIHRGSGRGNYPTSRRI